MAIDWLPSYYDLTDHHKEDIHQQLLDLVGHLKTFTDTLMAELPEDTTSIAKITQWSDQEVDALVQYFHKHCAETGDGNFKEATFSASAEFLQPLHMTGKIKDAKSVRNKWGQLKAIYAAISHYRNQSGFHWDNENGANIQGTTASQVFDTYVAKKGNGLMKNFRNRGWKYLEQVEDILPHGGALEERSYRGTIGVLPIILGPDQAVTGEHRGHRWHIERISSCFTWPSRWHHPSESCYTCRHPYFYARKQQASLFPVFYRYFRSIAPFFTNAVFAFIFHSIPRPIPHPIPGPRPWTVPHPIPQHSRC
ncbi:hypothetical protein HD554DRAFT_2210351 [Boletus coccyginus]|nr:hypothetical protein HD554DRAFT_2210351 [Boletus coccyginus]